MKTLYVFSLVVLNFTLGLCQDSVDEVNHKFEILASEGLETLYARQIEELKQVRETALTNRDLELATKADEKVEELRIQISKLQSTRPSELSKETKFPANEFYKMVSSNNKTGTEKGKEIVCRFEKLPLNKFSGDKVVLTLTANNSKYAESPHKVYIRNGSGGEEVGVVSGVKRGATCEIPLSISPADVLELVVVVKGGDALHLKPFTEGVPDLYLTIRK